MFGMSRCHRGLFLEGLAYFSKFCMNSSSTVVKVPSGNIFGSFQTMTRCMRLKPNRGEKAPAFYFIFLAI